MNAAPTRVWAVLHALRWTDLPLTRLLVTIRMPGFDADRAVFETPGVVEPIFEEAPRVSVGGMVGQPWHLRPRLGPEVHTLDDLREFDEPGWLKIGMDWVLSPLSGGRTLLETTTLCEATDRYAAARFEPYWLVIRAFSGLIRRDMLTTVARRLG